MICIGIPVCRPLYKRYLDKWTSRDASNKYQQQSEGGSYALQTYGGSMRPRRGADSNDPSVGGDSIMHKDRKIGLSGPFTKSYAIGGDRVRGDDQSDESILGHDFRRSQRTPDHESQGKSIRVTAEYEITTSRLDV
jgi:hypothetical protein